MQTPSQSEELEYLGTQPAVPVDADVRIRATLTTGVVRDGATHDEATELTIELGDDVCRFHQSARESAPELEIILDFARRRRVAIARGQGTYRADSLYAEVAFRAAELTNRQRLADVLQTSSDTTHPLSPALFAHQLSLATASGDDSGDGLRRSSDGDRESWHADERLLFSHSRRVRRLSPTQADRFVRFARYHLRGHPVILDYLRDLSGLPERMTWVQYGADERHTQTLTIAAIEPATAVEYRLDGLRRMPGADDWWSVYVHETTVDGELGKRRVAQELARAVELARTDGRYDEAVLLCLEYSMQNGPLPPGIATLEPFMGDPGAQAIMACVVGQQQVNNEADARTLIGSIRALRGHFTDHQHVLMMFEACMLTAIAEYDEAEALYRKILTHNRYLAGVYKDLGDLFVARYDMERAWRCWELARQLAPEHQRLGPIERFEHTLRAAHPEYF